MSDVTIDEAGRPVGLPASVMPAAFGHLHSDARASLASWSAPDADLERTRRRMLDVLETDPTAMWRFHSRVHFTASLIVLDASATHVALTLHAKARRWFQFGGHLEESDTTVATAALREGLEESGMPTLRQLPGLVDVDAHELPPAFQWCHEHLDLRFGAIADVRLDATVGSRDGLVTSEESVDVRWFSIDDLPDDAEPGLRRAIAATRQRVAGG